MRRLLSLCAMALGLCTLSACSGYGSPPGASGVTVFGTVDASAVHTR